MKTSPLHDAIEILFDGIFFPKRSPNGELNSMRISTDDYWKLLALTKHLASCTDSESYLNHSIARKIMFRFNETSSDDFPGVLNDDSIPSPRKLDS